MSRRTAAAVCLVLTVSTLGLVALAPTASAGPGIPCIVGWPVPCDPNGNFPFAPPNCQGDPTPQVWLEDFVNNFMNGDPDLGPMFRLSRCYS